MGRMSVECRQRAVTLWKSGMKLGAIQQRFKEEGKRVSVVALYNLVKKFASNGYLRDIKRRSRPSILGAEHYQYIDELMIKNDELTATNLYNELLEKFLTLKLSRETVRRARNKLGWISTTPKYCQLIREVNKEKRLKWCETIDNADTM